MHKTVFLNRAVKGALGAASTGSLVVAGAALAQTAAPAQRTAGSAAQLSRIVVTGSHIPRTSIASAQPVIRISRQDLEASGFTTVGQFLQNMSPAGSALNGKYIGEGNQGRAFGNGSEQIDLHNLGAKRTLVLVNGQRWVPELIGGVDLTSIPTSIIDHVEILLDGASTIYGSDAIAGVINIITVKNYNGAEAHTYFGMYDAHGDGGGWDGKTQRYTFTVGTSGDKAGVLLSAGYYDQQGISDGNRTLSKEPFIGTGNLLGSSGTLGGRFIVSGPTNGGYPCSGPDASGNYSCDLSGPLTGSNGHPFTNADRYNYAPANSLLSPSERWWVFSQAHYDLTDNITFESNVLYNRRNSTIVNAPAPIFYGAAGGTYANGLPVGVSGSNPYNPFGVDLVPAGSFSAPGYSAWCSLYGSGGNGSCSQNADLLILLGRRPVELGQRFFNQHVNTFRFDGGFSGYFQLAGNQWQWDAHYIYSDSLNTEVDHGHINNARAQVALSGACSTTPGCVPLDLFGGAGTITPAQAAYVMFTDHNVDEALMRNYNFNVAGNFFDGWYAGPWGVAVGYEYLDRNGYFQPDAINVQGNSNGVAEQPSEGRVATNAQYAELNVPLARNAFLAKSLDVDIAQRYSQFHVTGQVGGTGPARENYTHAATPRVTLKWKPINQLMIRGAWSEAFRVPSISELFVGPTEADINLVDPCVGNPTLPNCPPAAVQPNNQIRVNQSGNPSLNPEKSVSRSIGFVWSPDLIPGHLDVSADYYKIELVQAVGTLGGQTILDGCYLSNIQSDCALINRTGGQIVSVDNPNINAGSLKATGVDANLSYQFPLTAAGVFRMRATATFNRQFTVCNSTVTPSGPAFNCENRAGSVSHDGFGGVPKSRYNLSLGWEKGAWAATWNVTIIGRMYERCSDSALASLGGVSTWSWCSNVNTAHPDRSINELGTTVYHDIQGSYTISAWNATISMGIQNLFDKQPPIAVTAQNIASFLPSYYRIPGRFYYAKLSVNF